MKLATQESPVERFGVVDEESDFRIKATPKAFQILTSKLYKDKIAAIVREISCNAYDSHVAAGKSDLPFHVHLPNTLEPELVIRDFGVGLSDRDVRDIFTTFFESTKENTNEQIGALGLGGKSPFSYTDTYTVKSFFEGKLSTYVCFIENALPKVKRVSRVDTDEGNGVEIRLTVAPSDFDTFQRKAVAVFKWFDVKPTVTGGRYYTHAPDDAPLRNGENWYYRLNNSPSLAIMGNVAYPIDAGVLATHLSEFEKRLLTNFVYYFGIGELDVQAGREELSYDRQTIRALKKRVKAVSKELSAVVQHQFEDCQTFVEASRRYLSESARDLFQLVPPRWRGKVITGGVVPPCTGELVVRKHPKLRFARKTSRRGEKRISSAEVIEPLDSTVIFINDLKRGALNRFTKFGNDNPFPCYLFTPAPDGLSAVETLKAFADFGDVRLISSLNVERAKAKVRLLDRRGATNYSYFGREYRKDVEVDLDAGGVYILSRSQTPLGPTADTDIGLSTLQMWAARFYHTALDDIHLVPYTARKQFEAHPKWLTLFEAVEREIAKLVAKEDFVRGMNRLSDRKTFSFNLFPRSADIAARLPKNHPLNRFLEAYNEPQDEEAVAWYPLMLHSYTSGNASLIPLFDKRKHRLSKLWSGLDDLPLLKAVVSNSSLDTQALDDLALYSKIVLDKKKSSR